MGWPSAFSSVYPDAHRDACVSSQGPDGDDVSDARAPNWRYRLAEGVCVTEPMTHFLRDILRQPEELRRTLVMLSAGPAHAQLHEAVAAVRGARHVYLTGFGSSWHAAVNVGALFKLGARPVYLVDTAELLHFSVLPRDSVLIVISRSRRSVEIVHLLGKARAAGATVIGITNAPEGVLAREA